MESLLQSFKGILQAVRENETHCLDLAHEFLSAQKGAFTRKEMVYTANGLNVTYLCEKDGRTYDVHISPRR